MKKSLLLIGFLCAVTIAFAQKQYTLKPGAKVVYLPALEQQMTQAGPIVSSAGQLPAEKPAAPRDVNIVSVVDIGSSANVYTYGYSNGAATYTWYDKEINTVTNFHRMGGVVGPTGQYSGDLCYDVSFDGGLTWTNQVKVYTSNISGGEYNIDAARYPQGAIYNPVGNTDPNNAWMAFFACNLDGTNGGQWGGYSYGVGRFGDILDTTKHLLSSDLPNGYYQGIPTAFTICNETSTALMADASLLDSYTEYLDNIIFMRGIFNEGLGDFEYERFLVPADAEYARYLKMAMDPSGQIGYVYWNDDNLSIPSQAGWAYPLLIKTTDGGETWSDIISIELWGPNGLPGIKNWLSDEMINSLWDPPVPTRDEIMYSTPWFNSDIAVDAWGNPHLAATVFVSGPGLDPGYIIITPESFGVFDIYSIDDNNTDWQALNVGTLYAYTGDFPVAGGDPLTEYNRVQVSSDMDGKYMFLTWLDTRIEGLETNTSPDIYSRGFDLANNMMTNDEGPNAIAGATNVTAFSEAMWQAYFLSSSHYVIDAGDEGNMTFTIPMVYAGIDPTNVGAAVQFKYIQDFSFAEGDFILPTGNDPITGVGITENNPGSTLSVSQNYPNPFNNNSSVVVTTQGSTTLSLAVTNLIGQKVIEINRGPVSAGTYTFEIDGSKLTNGVYFYTVTSGKDKVTQKMVVE